MDKDKLFIRVTGTIVCLLFLSMGLALAGDIFNIILLEIIGGSMMAIMLISMCITGSIGLMYHIWKD
jgi:hypothetical protein